MRKIKSFSLFESTDYKVSDIIDLYHDIKSIEYILEEGNVDVMMSLRLVRTDRKESFSVEILSDDRIIGLLKTFPLEAIEIRITKRKAEWEPESILVFDRLVERYFNLLKEHLDYIESDRISLETHFIGDEIKLGVIKIKI